MALRSLRHWFRPRIVPLATDEAYTIWARTYVPYAHNAVMQLEESIVAPIIAACTPRRALDVGTGTGRNARLLATAGARAVISLDRSEAMLQRHVMPLGRVQGDARALPFADASFDFVCASLMAGDLRELRQWILEAARVLAAGGHLVYSDFHPAWRVHGWRRTFTGADGRTCELPYVHHAIEEHLAHCAAAALEVRAIREPRLAPRSSPILAVFHVQKPARRGHAGAPSTSTVWW
jgi:malonyl-CoA O-methyltransferase